LKKYQSIEAWIRKGIAENKFPVGEKLPSESQLCAQFSVSRNAVRQALRNLTQEGLVESLSHSS
jgi:DNA-binding GntR family transcriptional regulator